MILLKIFVVFVCLISNSESYNSKNEKFYSNSFNLSLIEKSIVLIKVNKRSYPTGNAMNNSPFEVIGLGAIVSSDGYILTNNSFLGEATSVEVFLGDKKIQGSVYARDLQTDLAIIKINSTNLTPIQWSNFNLRQGADVFIIGSPYNLVCSLMKSIISFPSRESFQVGNVKSCYGNLCENFNSELIQYESSVVSKIYGGLVFDSETSTLSGITTPIYDDFGAIGFKFAIPSKVAQKVSKDLIAHKKVLRPFLNISLQDIEKEHFKAYKMDSVQEVLDIKKQHNLPDVFGCIVTSIEKNSALQKAGLKQEDIIISLKNEITINLLTFSFILKNLTVGEKISMRILRKEKNGSVKMHTINFTVEAAKEKLTSKIKLNKSSFFNIELIKFVKGDKVLKSTANLHDSIDSGLVISKIENKVLSKNLAKDDVILNLQGQPIQSIEDFDRIVEDSLKKNEKYIIFLIARKDIRFTYAIEINKIREGE